MSLGESLITPPPDFPPEAAAMALAAHWGLSGTLTPLTSERDVNYRVNTATGRFVLKLANPAESPAITEFQTLALLHLEASRLPVPRVVRTMTGQAMVATPRGVLRLLTYLDGRMMHLAPRSRALAADMGRMSARLARGLEGFSHPAADHVLQWDIRQAAGLAPLLDDLPPDLLAPARRALTRFLALEPALNALPFQVVHNDLNPHNLLVSEDGTRVTGILDFGDMVRTPRICDAAVAASYQADAADVPGTLTAFAGAYHAQDPLVAAELALLPDLVATRWLTTLAITAHRARLYPANAGYILRNVPQARAGLLALEALGAEDLAYAIRKACP